jgi:glutamate carboxypeptidase
MNLEMKMTLENDVLAFLKTHEGEMLTLLEQLVNADSGSYDKAGVDACGDIITNFLRKHELEVEIDRQEIYGDTIRGILPAHAANDRRPIIMMGHRDTVFPKGTPAKRPFSIKYGRAYGPGVVDMKPGLVTNLFVLAALKACGFDKAPVTALITGDEEIGSPASRPVIEREARLARCVFNSEPSMVKDGVKIINGGRKGGLFSRLEIKGKAAHAGNSFTVGRSAIHELSRKIVQLEALTDLEAGITVNIGLIGGGQSSNTVAPSAFCEIDCRIVTVEQRNMMYGKIKAICEEVLIEGTSSHWFLKGEFYPLEVTPANKVLQDIYREAASEIGMKITTQFSGGCADSGFTSAAGCPTICSIGPSGGFWHTDDEYVEISSLLPAAQALALSVIKAAMA